MMGANLIKQTNTPPNYSFFNSHYFCDYIELLALINNDIVSVSDVYDRFLEDNQIELTGDSERSATDDRWNTRIHEWYSLLEIRQSLFKDFYPFETDSNKICLKEDLNNSQYSYIFLLLNSTRKYLNDHNQLPTDFEAFSLQILKNYLPDFSHVHQFGKTNIEHERYKGHIKDKINKLASDLMCETKYKDHFFAEQDSGDGGLDLVAWIPFCRDGCLQDMNKNNIQVYLGQCATGKNWLNKQDDTNKFPNKYIAFNGQLNYIMFIPYDGRNSDCSFNEEAKMGDYLLFDRFRLLSMISDTDLIEKFPSLEQIVKKVVDLEEPII